ncbi:DMT family transporter [Mangrovibacillus cuniculi]|uniref:Multidrug efflux SMR transporter n=1 Tax=Mangrovibacillus cuniculi TaxID=2593652 RepID=A0A7S8CDW2_9BACI|nr:multidrug efflux SMR transporter [Mangrovibacillus cuniculi]QPC48175.1 multidrug efflux SMR transporter [Mangrovibacillus cuniculi]
MAWMYLILAGLFEVGLVTFMKLSDGFTKKIYLVLTLASGLTSFFLLSKALESIPLGLGYGIWTGIGAAGGVIFGMIFFGEKKDWRKILFVSMIIVGVMGLKMAG